MSLILRPHPDGLPDEFRVMHGELQIGSIKKMRFMSAERWLWTLSNVLIGAPGIRFSGATTTCEEAGTALRENWDRWLDWAELSERPSPPSRAAKPQVLSVTISKIE